VNLDPYHKKLKTYLYPLYTAGLRIRIRSDPDLSHRTRKIFPPDPTLARYEKLYKEG